ncbi:helix-turn-helix transcriptional regulator [Bacteroides caecimuris]|uniref:helix-turn-helix domain-containing protein n=1 Tax=Bacteroides caecimuris TaxID=1796613 RepID=UPI00242E29ED|nr:helix-turn-helix transcriptional regulator [Bacteroides caecimuris]
MESKFKDIYIGKLIQQKVDERGISYAEFARQIHCARTSLYHIFNSKNIDVERLLLISEVLQYNFIEEVYLRKLKSTDENIPCIVIPFKEKGIDTSQLPNELLEWLKQQLL